MYGEAKAKMDAAFRTLTEVEAAASFDEAVLGAVRTARSGETVLLSPACASFDCFKNYAERGERFRKLVQGAVK